LNFAQDLDLIFVDETYLWETPETPLEYTLLVWHQQLTFLQFLSLCMTTVSE